MDSGIGTEANVTVVDLSATDVGSHGGSSSKWHFFGQALPRSEIVFFVQVTLVFIVVIVSIVNITMQHPDSQLWIALLSSSVGYLLLSPTLNQK